MSLAASSVVLSAVMFSLPVTLGRLAIAYIGGTDTQVHELYTVSTGLYMCYVCMFGAVQASQWLAQEWQAIRSAVHNAAKIVSGRRDS